MRTHLTEHGETKWAQYVVARTMLALQHKATTVEKETRRKMAIAWVERVRMVYLLVNGQRPQRKKGKRIPWVGTQKPKTEQPVIN